MQKYSPPDIRNFAIVGHASCGKTMLSEAMLACSRRHRTHGPHRRRHDRLRLPRQRKTAPNFHPDLAPSHPMDGQKFKIIDTPGYLDFVSEALSALRVADFALVVVHSQHGIGVGTERVWKFATEFGIPKILVVNALDKLNSNFDEALAAAREHFGAGVFP